MDDNLGDIFREFGFKTKKEIHTDELGFMNRPRYFLEHPEEEELKKYNLQTVAYKSIGMGHYLTIGKKSCLRQEQNRQEQNEEQYYFLSLGGSSGYEALDTHITAQHYCHQEDCGQTLVELVDYFRDNENKKFMERTDFGAFPLADRMTKMNEKYSNYDDKRKFFGNPKNENKCYMCSMIEEYNKKR